LAIENADESIGVPKHDIRRLWLALALIAMADGMGWGIRGQYGIFTLCALSLTIAALVIGRRPQQAMQRIM
jgi:hypothetical protein